MQCQWIMLGTLLALGVVFNWVLPVKGAQPRNSANELDNREIKRLLTLALQVINETERQRVLNKNNTQQKTDVPTQRPNSKRLRWRTNSKQLEWRQEEPKARAAFDYSTEIGSSPNPTYIDVRDNTPRPAAWWW